MFPIKEFDSRFREVLGELDALCDEVADEPCAEDLEDLSAELEDALMLLGDIRPEQLDWKEELDGALEAFDALADDLERMSKQAPEAGRLGERLRMLTRLAADNMRD